MAETSLNVVITSDPAGAITGLRAVKDAADSAGSGMTKSFDKATSETGNLFTHLGQSMANWGIPFAQTVENVGKKLDDAKSHGKGFQQGLSDVGATALVVGGVALAGIAYESVKMADDFESAQRRLQTALKNTNESFTANSGVIQAANTQGEKYGYTYTQTESALATGVTATGNVTKATRELTIAENVAAGRHIDLASAMNLVVKAGEGQTTALHRAGIDLPIVASSALKVQNAYLGLVAAQDKLSTVQSEVADGQLKGKAALDGIATAQDKVGAAQQKLTGLQSAGGQTLDALSDKYRGAADAAGKTLGGQLGTLSAQFQDVGIKIGQFLIPKLEDIGGAISDVIGWFQRNKDVAIALAGVFTGVLAAAIGAFVVNKVASTVHSMMDAFNTLAGLSSKVVGFFSAAGGSASTAGGEVAASGVEADTAGGQWLAGGAEAETAGGLFEGAGGAAEAGAGQMALFGGGADVAAGGVGALVGGLGVVSVLAIPAYMIAMGLGTNSAGKLSNAHYVATESTRGLANEIHNATDDVRTHIAQVDNLYQANGHWVSSQSDLQGKIFDNTIAMAQNKAVLSDFNNVLANDSPAAAVNFIAAMGQAHVSIGTQISALEDMKQKYPQLDSAIDGYIEKLIAIPLSKKTEVDVNDQATPTLQQIQGTLDRMQKAYTVTVTTAFQQIGTPLAEGGIITGPQIALIGEAGPEAVIPLSDPARAGEILNEAGLIAPFPSGGAAASSAGAPVVFNNYVTVSTMVASDPAGIGQALITDFLEPAERRMGTDWRQRTHR